MLEGADQSEQDLENLIKFTCGPLYANAVRDAFWES